MKALRLSLFALLLIPTLLFINGCSQWGSGNRYADSESSAFLSDNGLPGNHPKQVALLLPLQGTLAPQGAAIKDGFEAAARSNGNPFRYEILDSSQTPISTLYQNALSQGATLIIGPLEKPAVQSLASSNLAVPVLALNTLGNGKRVENLYQFGLSPQDEAVQVANRAWNDGRRRALIIFPQGSWGTSIAQSFKNQWEGLGGQVLDNVAYTSQQSLDDAVKKLLDVQWDTNKKPAGFRRSDADMVFVVAYPSVARQILPLLKFYGAQSVIPYSISLAYGSVPAPNMDNDLNGLVFCDMPWVLGEGKQVQLNYNSTGGPWPETRNTYTRLYALGMDAYQLAAQMRLTRALPRFGYVGVTGQLYLDRDQTIRRRLQCAQIRNGQAEPL